MARTNKWPSKWWFWGPFLAANVYVFMGLFDPLSLYGSGGPARRAILNFLDLSLCLVCDSFADPIAEALNLGENLALYVGVVAASYELAAVVVSAVLYGSACLIYTIIPESGREGESDSHG